MFEHWLEPVFEHAHPYLRQAGYSHGLEWGLMGLATTLAVVGFLVARWLYVDAKNPIPAMQGCLEKIRAAAAACKSNYA